MNYEPASVLAHVPGFSKNIISGILSGRPFRSREDMKRRVKGLGEKAFENCAGFVRVEGSPEILDDSRVHVKDYDIAKFLMNAFQTAGEIKSGGKELLLKYEAGAAEKKGFDLEGIAKNCIRELKVCGREEVTVERVLDVHRVMIEKRGETESVRRSDGESEEGGGGARGGGIELPKEFRDKSKLSSLPTTLRAVRGKVQNIVDFGVFVDFGMSGVNGLIHVSKLGREGFSGLVVGRGVLVDIIRVDAEGGRVGLKRHECDEGGGSSGHGKKRKAGELR